MMLLDPRWVQASKGEEGQKKKQANLGSDNVAGG
jgi:hypothetical protein